MTTANHAEVKEILEHLDIQLSAVKASDGDFYAWSDGDQLRAIAYSHVQGAHHAFHMIAGLDAVDVQVPRTLLRIAARLDLLDEGIVVYESDRTSWLTAAEAAEKIGKSTGTLSHWCRTGRIRAEKRGRLWFIDPTSIGVEA